MANLHSQNSILWSESQGQTYLPGKTYCATDLLGNVYVASSVNGTALDWQITSYRPDSVLRWTFGYTGTGNTNDVVSGIIVDSLFGVYVAGTTSEASDDVTVLALDSAGNQEWIQHYDRGGDETDICSGITEYGGFLYVSGAGYKYTTGYDYEILKFSKSGSLVWDVLVNGTFNGDDFTSSIDNDVDGNVYVTGKTEVSGGTYDILTVKCSPSGSVSWSKYYGLTSGKNDFGTALTADATGQVYIVGQSYINTTNSDLVVIRYLASNGSQKWVARYNGTYSGIDLASAVIASNGSIFVLGTAQIGASDFNFVTLHYNASGKAKWMQQYDGPVNGIDEARTLIEDGDDIVVSGRSMGTKNFDVTTISYQKQSGAINWTIRYDGTIEGAEDVASLAKDEMGNILVGCFMQDGVFTHTSDLVKIHQKVKNDLAIERNLEVLATGFSDLKNDTVFKRIIWYNILRGFDDSIYLMYADQLRTLGDAAGLNATSKISRKIASSYSWNSSFNWAVIKSNQIWNRFGSLRSIIGIPELYQFSKSEFITFVPNAAYTHTKSEYPIGCTTCEDGLLDENDIVGKSSWVFYVTIPPFIYAPGKLFKPIVNCFTGIAFAFPHVCEVCAISTPSLYTNPHIGGAASHEIGIYVDLGDGSDTCATLIDANASDNFNIPGTCVPFCLASSYYAVVEALPGVYWRKQSGALDHEIVLVKSIMPHIVDMHGAFPLAGFNRQFGNRMTLCKNENLFYDYYSTGGGNRFMLDFGGVYKISRPGITGIDPMYFYFSPFGGYNFAGAPDMNMNFYGNVQGSNCTNGNADYIQNENLRNCLFEDFTDSNTYLINSRHYFANPNHQFLNNYWSDNVVAVGIGRVGFSGASVLRNYVEFVADTLNSTCNPFLFSNIGSLVCTLNCSDATALDEGDRYESIKYFDSSATYLAGDTFIVHVIARFNDGETIDQCQYLVLNSNHSFYDVTACMFRGDIADYNSATISYRVEVYETN